MRFEAVNNVLILKKDTENEFDRLSVKDMKQIPPPYTGVIDSVGYDDCGYKVGDRVAFEEIGGVLLSTEIEDYVVITPEMVIGIL
jgi:hypothetical protein